MIFEEKLKSMKQSLKQRMNSMCILSSIRLPQLWPSPRMRLKWNEDASDFTYKLSLYKFEYPQPASKLNPKARSGHRLVADEAGDLYSFGGFNIKVAPDDSDLSREPEWQTYKPLFQELWKFNWRSRRWKKIKTTGDIPTQLVSHCMCYWNQKIITYGGTGLPYGDNSSNKLTIYHIDRNLWERVEPLSDPTKSPIEMYGQACVCDEQRGELYIVGGTNGSQYSLDVHKFNLHTKKWSLLYKSVPYDVDYQPGCRYRHEIALYNNKLYLFGGSTNSKYYGFKTLPYFDLEISYWGESETKPFVDYRGKEYYPGKRKCHSLSVIGNDCYIYGGTDGTVVCRDLWHINLDKLEWKRLPDYIQFPVYFHAAAISLGCKLTVFGGVDDTVGESRNDKLTSVWLKIPKLKTLCLSAVGYYFEKEAIDANMCRETGLHEALELADVA